LWHDKAFKTSRYRLSSSCDGVARRRIQKKKEKKHFFGGNEPFFRFFPTFLGVTAFAFFFLKKEMCRPLFSRWWFGGLVH